MKITNYIAVASIVVAHCFAQGISIPENDPLIKDSLTGTQEAELRPEELAEPPAGQFKKLYLRDIGYVKAALEEGLANAPSGSEGRESQWFKYIEGIKVGLDKCHASGLQRDILGEIPKLSVLFEAIDSQKIPEYLMNLGMVCSSLGRTVISVIAQYGVEHNAMIIESDREPIVSVFAVSGFLNEPDWEDQRIPIDAAGVFIMDSAGVLAQLKAQPWQRAERFLAGWDVASAFERYGVGGDGLEVLKVKYGMERGVIEARWGELMGWVASEREKAGEEG